MNRPPTPPPLPPPMPRKRRGIEPWMVMLACFGLAGVILFFAIAFQSDAEKRRFRLKGAAEEMVKKRIAFPETAKVTVQETKRYQPSAGAKNGALKFAGEVTFTNAFGVPLRQSWVIGFDSTDNVTDFQMW